MLDGLMLIDAHLHPARLPTLKPAWLDWARQYGQPGWEQAYDAGGSVIPQAFDDLLEAEGVDHALLLCEYSPKVTGIQPAEELLPIIKHNPARFAFLANVNPHLHHPVAGELARQLALGAVGLKVHPVHGGFSAADPMLYPAYQACAEAGLPVVVHCGTSSFPGSDNSLAAPDHLLPVLRDFPGLTPHRLPDYYARFDLRRLARKFIFATDWPGVPGIAANARAVAALGLGDDVLAAVLAGNARSVYPGLGP